MRATRPGSSTLTRLVALFVVAVIVDYPWELAQSALFAQTVEWRAMWWHCFVAGLGDGILVWTIYIIGWAVYRRPTWFERPGRLQYAMMLTAGGLVAVIVEWMAVHVAHRWTYTAAMPLIPGLDIGAVPIFQMLVLPPMIFRLVAAWTYRARK
jgi:hypothetical protein